MVTAEKDPASTLVAVSRRSFVVQVLEQSLQRRCKGLEGTQVKVEDEMQNSFTDDLALGAVSALMRMQGSPQPMAEYRLSAAFMNAGHICMDRDPDYEDNDAKVWLLHEQALGVTV